MTETVQSTAFGAINRTSSNMCGVTLMNNQNGYVVAEIMAGKPGVTISEFTSMIRVDGVNSITFDFQEITDALGSDSGFTPCAPDGGPRSASRRWPTPPGPSRSAAAS